MLLEELLSVEDFKQAADRLAGDFRARFGLPPLFQLGLVVENVERSAARLEALGIGPFLILEGPAKQWRERGLERKFRGKMGLAYRQGIQLELLEPGEGSDFYRQSLAPSSGIAIQHLGFWVRDVDSWSSCLAAAGAPVWIQGRLRSGLLSVNFVYLDSLAQAGFVIEFLCWRILGIPFRLPARAAHGLGRLEKLIGKRSLAA